jgi:hypothetical protein
MVMGDRMRPIRRAELAGPATASGPVMTTPEGASPGIPRAWPALRQGWRAAGFSPARADAGSHRQQQISQHRFRGALLRDWAKNEGRRRPCRSHLNSPLPSFRLPL